MKRLSMQAFILCILLSLTAVPGVAGARAWNLDRASALLVPKGTPITVHLTHPVSSASVKLGDSVDLEVVKDVAVDGVVIFPKGGRAQGFVAEAEPANLWGVGRLTIYVGSVETKVGFIAPTTGVVSASANAESKDVTLGPNTEFVVSTDIDLTLEREPYVEGKPAGSAR